MKEKTRIWLRSGLSAIINSAAGGVSGALSGVLVKPEIFNLQAGLADLINLGAHIAVAFGVLGLVNFLKESPLPGHTSKGRQP